MGKGVLRNTGHRGMGTKYSLGTFRTVAGFTPHTRVKYGPNIKSQGSKSYERYQRYMQATTIGEALKLGSKPSDLCWELERGMYKVLDSPAKARPLPQLQGMAKGDYDECVRVLKAFKGPHGLATALDNEMGEEQLAQEEAWRHEKRERVKKLAAHLGIKLETDEELEAAGIHECADIRAERRVADELAKRKLASRKKVTDADVTEMLHAWGFCMNVGRLNVLPAGRKWVYSDTLGVIRRRMGGWGVTPPTLHYPNVTKLLLRWLQDNKPPLPCKFVCTSINVNANYAASRHRDGNNEGPSVIKAFGDFTGGRLHYWPKDTQVPRPRVDALKPSDAQALDIKKATAVFDGNRAHSVEDFEGDRFSIVYFSARGYGQAKPEDTEYAKSLGFPWPTPKEMATLKRAVKAHV